MAEPGGIPPMVLGGWIGAIVAAVGGPPMLIKSVQWLGDRADRRRQSRADGNREWEAKLKAWEDDLDRRSADNLRQCEQHCAELRGDMEKMRFAIVLILPEVERFAPSSPLLQRASDILGEILRVPIKPVPAPPAQLELPEQTSA